MIRDHGLVHTVSRTPPTLLKYNSFSSAVLMIHIAGCWYPVHEQTFGEQLPVDQPQLHRSATRKLAKSLPSSIAEANEVHLELTA